MQEPQYLTTPAGVRWQDTRGNLSPTLQEGLALLYDRETGVLLKHGEPAHVERYFARITAALTGTTLADDIEMCVFELDTITPELLAEINRSIQIAGYISRFISSLRSPPDGQEAV